MQVTDSPPVACTLDHDGLKVRLAERCCAFLGFTIEAACGKARLTIAAPPGPVEASRLLFLHFLPATAAAGPELSGCDFSNTTRCS